MFRYGLSISGQIEDCVEEYIIKCTESGELAIEKTCSGIMEHMVGNVSYASGIFDTSNLIFDRSEYIDTRFGKINVNVFISDVCGGSTTVWVGKDNLAYIVEKTQLWSGGKIYKEIRVLLEHSKR